MFFAGKPLFLRGGDNLPILYQTGRTIMIKS
jgi:hypothetical protein